ncbi:serine protein kinase RIO [Methanobacterium sp. CWC-01]|jgi:RIO kinase 1|uniref:serine protein kinase RIO n=1 Tax=Methanobacterium aridiramus TaxID=2584467 RepID=UPI002576B236|nr:serine protein kinase RIO [Methanobacterium sp. CWC-01]WJI09249.1 serine protein kinase RIO [Methanobacterium sp. CWC-01]
MDSKISKADYDLQKMREIKRLKSVEDKRTGSEVFDRLTLETLYKLAKQGYINLLKGAISTGKEANVFKGVDDQGNLVAVKIYRVSTSDFKKMQYYIQGDPRFKVNTSNKRQMIKTWVMKEFRNLKRAEEAGIPVPHPIIAKNNVLVMEFIGDSQGNPSPLMRETEVANPKKMVNDIVDIVAKLYNDAKIVHGDLSSFNILIREDNPVIIDVSQAVVRDHPLALELLKRDIENLIRDFKKLGINISIDEIKSKIMDVKG